MRKLREALDAILREAFPPGASVALIGRPLHHNVGDHLIWVSQMKWFQRNGHKVIYTADLRSHSGRRLRRALGSRGAVVALTGGGNLGDIWAGEQRLREQVLNEFADVPTVQLPQSVMFNDPAAEGRWLQVAQSHQALTILVRDAESYRRTEGWNLDVRLAPDAAFGHPAVSSVEPIQRSLWLLRQDIEALVTGPSMPGAFDWARPSTGGPQLRILKRLVGPSRRTRISAAVYERLANAWMDVEVRRGIDLLSPARIIVTDRLHAHLLALLMGRVSILLDNSYGKSSSLHSTWLTGLADSLRAETVAEANRMVRDFDSIV